MRQVITLVILFFLGHLGAQPDTSVYRKYSIEYVNEIIETVKDPDTLAAAYYHRARKMLPSDNDECIRLFEEGLPLIKALGKDSVYYQAKMFYVLPLVNGTRFEDAFKEIQACKNYYIAINDLFRLASAYAVEGFLQEELSNFDEAAELFRKSLDIYQNNEFSNVHYGINNVNNHLGIIYTGLGDNEKAVEYFEKVRSYSKENGVDYFYRAATNNLAESLIASNKKEEAIPHIKEVIEIRKASSSNVARISMYSNLSKLAEIEDNIELALVYQDSSIYYAEQLNNHIFRVRSYIAKGKLFKESGQNKAEKAALKNAENLSSEFGIESMLPEIYLALGENELRSNNPSQAGRYYQQHIASRDSLNKVQQLKDLDKKEAALAIQRFNEELMTINASANVKFLELEKQKERNRFLIIFSVFTIGIISLLFRNNRIKKRNQLVLAKQNSEIESNLNDKEILLKEIHHRVKNNLQVVSSMLNLNLRFVKDPAAKSILLESRNRVKSMALIHQQLYQEDYLKGIKLKSYFESLCNNLIHSYREKGKLINIHYEVQDLLLDVDTMIPIGLIVNELISNSLKHAFDDKPSGNIWVFCQLQDENLCLRIKDDGVGFVKKIEDESKTNFGMNLIQSLSEKLKAEAKFSNGEGTTVELLIHKFSMYN